jgi:uncharacterized protein (DUF885 family)
MLLKLRADAKRSQGNRFSLRSFHDTILGFGGLTLPLQREALLGEAGVVLD